MNHLSPFPAPANPDTGMTLRVLGVQLDLDASDQELRLRAIQQAGVQEQDVLALHWARRSLDARRTRGILRFVCHVDLVMRSSRLTSSLKKAMRSGKVREAPARDTLTLPPGPGLKNKSSVVVVGSGPGGFFAALTLALNGAQVTMVERGSALEGRHKKLVPFHRGGSLDPDTNLLFGEGGAGTYSDGKLYTRVQDSLELAILEELVAAGAPESILFDARAHIGTDRLHRVLPALRARLIEAGGSIQWETRFEGLVIRGGQAGGRERRIAAVRTSRGEIQCDALVLAIGHSARDTFEVLHGQGVVFEPKPFQFGVRVEHPQELITRGRFGDLLHAETLGPASYNLALKGNESVLGSHSFCMCPGGKIVASISEPGMLCTNGMSNAKHSSPFANSAVVATVSPDAYATYGQGPLAGLAFQRHFERLFFEAGGGDYTAPAQRIPDFLEGRASRGDLHSSYTFGTKPGRIDQLLPPDVRQALARGLTRFDRQIEGFAGEQGLMVGLESRSSSPVRMPRNRDTYTALGFSNLFPIGEGAGYAGGIMSAAIDGARAAHVLLRTRN
ncbi:MAG: FAD-dependent monooxygenase [Planctomycetes bacterium]|nr:FAD-dependent monooxygenase [Planctomycetota bacterium]